MKMTARPVRRRNLVQGFHVEDFEVELRNPTKTRAAAMHAAHLSRERLSLNAVQDLLGIKIVEDGQPSEVHLWVNLYDFIVGGYSILSPDNDTVIYSIKLRPVRRVT